MSRIRIPLPETFVFETELSIRVSDLNYGGHVGNDSVLSLMQEARTQFYRKMGFDSEVKLVGNVGQIVADAAVVYRSESFLGDVLQISLAINDMNRYGFDLYYLLTNKATGKEVAHGKTGIICFDYGIRKVAEIPELLKERLLASSQHELNSPSAI